MERRSFLAVAGVALAGGTAACQAGEDAPRATVTALELENHRQDGRYPFAVEIRDGEKVVFEESLVLEAAGDDGAVAAFEEPVDEPGAYTVRAAAGDGTATAETGELISAEEPCLRLRFYLGARTLHLEHQTYQRC